MKNDYTMDLPPSAVIEAFQEYLAKRINDGYVPVVIKFEGGSRYENGKEGLRLLLRDPHRFLDKGAGD